MNDSTDFTVLMAVYKNDDDKKFYSALKSVFDNSVQPKYVFLVVDGPIPKKIQNIIEYFSRYEVFKTLYLEKNMGFSYALNYGLDNINTPWVIRADADDVNRLDRFKLLKENMNNNIDLIGSAIEEVDYYGNKINIKKMPISNVDIIHYMKKRNPFNHMSVAFRTEIVKKLGGYPHIYLREDYALWIKLANNKARMINLPDVLVNATTGDNMYKRRGGIKYALGEIELQKYMVNNNIKNYFSAVIDGILRSSVFLMPFFLRKYVYKFFLR